MNIPEKTHEAFGGDLNLYMDVYRYTSMSLTKAEIAQVTGEKESKIHEYMCNLRKTVATLPPDELSQEALYGYITMADNLEQDMMRFYNIMMEDFEYSRSTTPRTDGKKTTRVQAKDVISLMQTMMKTRLEKASVLTRFAAVSPAPTKQLPGTQPISAKSLMDTGSKEIEIEIIDVEFENVSKAQ